MSFIIKEVLNTMRFLITLAPARRILTVADHQLLVLSLERLVQIVQTGVQ